MFPMPVHGPIELDPVEKKKLIKELKDILTPLCQKVAEFQVEKQLAPVRA